MAIPGEPDEPQGDHARRPRAGRLALLGGTTPRDRIWRRRPSVRSGWAARPGRDRDRRARHGSTATPTATSPSMPSPMRCSARPAWATSDGSSRPARRRPRGIASAELLGAVVERLAAQGYRPASVDLTIVGARPRLADRLDAMRAAIAQLLGLPGRGRQRQGLDGQPHRRRRRRSRRRGAGRRRRRSACGESPPASTRSPASSASSSRSNRGTSGSTAAARRSTARPTSATSARSCSPTCWSATCAIAARASPGSMNITDIDDKIIRGAAAAGETIGDLTTRWSRAFPDRRDGSPDDGARRPAPGHRAHPRDRDPGRAAPRDRSRLSDRRRLDLLPDRVLADLRAAGPSGPRAAPGGRAGRGRRVRQGRRARLRALEGGQAGRALVVDGGRRRPAGLAHRVLGHEHASPRRDVRHPHAAGST